MARKDALLRLHDRLLAQRDDLRRKLAGELEEASQVGTGSTDLVDAVYDDQERELHSQLVSLEGRELERIEKAIAAIRAGTYGRCERCQNPIPVARLKLLPYVSCCIRCQEREEARRTRGDAQEADWESVDDYQRRLDDREYSISDLSIGMESV
jgi:DnaK suppressor protein